MSVTHPPELKVFNNLSREKEIFKPIHPGKVGMYVCGVTTYDLCHVGHSRVYIVFDVVYRYLKHLGYEVNYVRNITDIDDKILQRAAESGQKFTELTRHYIDEMHQDFDALGILRPDFEPRATEHMDEIIRMIQTLIEKEHAYQAENGDVYFKVAGFERYGLLSGKKLEQLQAGQRVEVDPYKQNPLDFVLWKSAKTGEPGWASPFGEGRPGWHIECSAMSTEILGAHFDIHGGGQDLQFPHHENEIAQSECCYDEKFVNYWMHNGFVRLNDEKMSKSLGNFFTIRDLLKQYRAEELRLFILSSHYRSPINYSDESLEQARQGLQRLYTALLDVPFTANSFDRDSRFYSEFEQAMLDDFNTSDAIAVLFELARELNKAKQDDSNKAGELAAQLVFLGRLLGLLQENPEVFLKSSFGDEAADGLDDAAIEEKVQQRVLAKQNKDWALADQIRDELQQAGIVVEDSPQGTRWKRS